jgi:hypothetical protein
MRTREKLTTEGWAVREQHTYTYTHTPYNIKAEHPTEQMHTHTDPSPNNERRQSEKR